MKDPVFDSLQKLYRAAGYSLYIVGGTARDLLLGRDFSDRDYVTDATPEEEKAFLKDANYAFERFGSVKMTYEGQEIDVTTLRKEEDYQDFRHPGKVIFVKTPKRIIRRRDFTINALYLTSDYSVLDYCGGLADLKNKIIRFIGDPARSGFKKILYEFFGPSVSPRRFLLPSKKKPKKPSMNIVTS
jgi:tRNA nucleotidyltransferase (CCA-adding enzyme)